MVQLSSATNSDSETLAATPKAVKAAYDLANAKYTAQDATTARKGIVQLSSATNSTSEGTVAKLAMRQPFVLFKGLTFQKLCLPGAFRPGDHHNKMLRPGLCVVHASPQYL
ncbi:phage tail protein (plasmid) [Salmonella enterica subsp. enterica]